MTQKELKEMLIYDESTGHFTWKMNRSCKVRIGKRAGSRCKNSGYRVINIKGVLYREHRLAFLYMLNYLPNFVDHIDRVRDNNKWVNLREATKSQNGANRLKDRDNKSGHKGVHYSKARSHLENPWLAYIKHKRRKIYIGYYKTKEEAALARDKKAIELYGEFAVLNREKT